MTNTAAGSCHCGAVRVRFTSSGQFSRLAVRACGCSFCTKHGARTTTDPSGQLELEITNEAHLLRYRFGLNTADYLVCRRCGVYIAAVLTDGAQSWATLNINLLDPPADDPFPAPIAADYSAEDRDARIARRKARWTPTTLQFAPATPATPARS